MNLRPVSARRDAAWIALSFLALLAWDLSEFGRSARHVSHWALGVNDGGPGRCFPSGHASAASSLFGSWFALRGTSPRAARRWLAGVWVFGILFSVAQTLRGAHYPSHSMWTAWVCFTTSALLWHAAQPLLIRRRSEIRTWCPRFFRR